jgi:hypothetical protein
MASSSHSDSGPYKCPTDPCGEFNNLKDFFSKTHLEKHEYRCPMSDCPGKPGTSYNFRVHWMRTHLEHFGLQEEREVCNMCGESYPKGNKFNHERRHFAARPESNKRRRDHAEIEPAAPVPKDDIWRISKEAYDDVQTIMHAGSPPSNSSGLSGPVPAHHGTDFEAGLSEYSEWLLDVNNSWTLLPLSETLNPTTASIDMADLMVPSLTTSPSDLDMHLIPFNTNFAGTNGETSQVNIQAVSQDLDWSVHGRCPRSHRTDATEQRGSVLATLGMAGDRPIPYPDELDGNHLVKRPRLQGDSMMGQRQNVMSATTSLSQSSTRNSDTRLAPFTRSLDELTRSTHRNRAVIDRYRLNQQRFKQARAGSRTIFTYSQSVAVERFAREMPTQNIASFRQWLRKVEHAKGIFSTHFSRLKVIDMHIHADAQLVKSTRTIRVSKFYFPGSIYGQTDSSQMFKTDHPAFLCCEQGNWQELNRMLSMTEVTVVDVNSYGETLLHVSPILLESINGSYRIRDLTLSDRSRL